MTDEMRVSYGFPLRVALYTDMGRVRTNNEDSHGFAWLPDGSLFVIVADGMGGHDAGEVASGLAVQVLEEVISRDLEADPRERLYNGLLEANEAILQEGRASGTRGMGTTAVAMLCRGPEVYVGLVGDSRLYHIRRGHLIWRTLDHTRVQMLIDQGQVPEISARKHPESGMLTRALGHSKMADGRPLIPDVLAEPVLISRDDALVLCSDGLHDLVEDWEIGKIIAGKAPAHAAKDLVAVAIERGGHDNITVAVITAGERTSEFEELPNSSPPTQGGGVPGVSASQEAEPSAHAAPPPPAPAPHTPVALAPEQPPPAQSPPAPAQSPPTPVQITPPKGLPAPDAANAQAPTRPRSRPPQPAAADLSPAPLAPLPMATIPAPLRPSEEATVVGITPDLDPMEEIAPTSAGSASIARKTPGGGLIFGLAAVTVAGFVGIVAVIVILTLVLVWAITST